MRRSIRRGSALILVLIMTLALAALASSAIYMTSSSGMLSRFHDKERDLAFAAETALELAKSRLQRDGTLALYDTGYKQLDTNRAVYNVSGTAITGLTVNVYAAYTGDTSGVYVPYVTLLATVSDPSGVRLARRMDLNAQSFSRYTLFANSLASGTIGAGETFPGRVHVNGNFYGASSGTPNPVFFDTVSATGTITLGGQWADTLNSVTTVPFPTTTTALAPSAAGLAARYSALASAGNTSFTPLSSTPSNAWNWTYQTTSPTGWNQTDVSGTECGSCNTLSGSRLEFVAFDVNNSGAIDSTEGFFRIFDIQNGGDTLRLATNFPGGYGVTQQVFRLVESWNDQCGAFYTLPNPTTGVRQREFFPVAMHSVTWVQSRIQLSTYPTVTAGQASAMGDSSSTAYRTIMQQPTARCFPYGSPYLMNMERYTNNTTCVPIFSGFPGFSTYTWGSAPVCGATQRYGGQDTTFTARAFACTIKQSTHNGDCPWVPVELGAWRAYGGTNSLPANLAPVRQTTERAYLWPISATYNPNYRGVIYANGRLFLSGTVRGRATLYVNGPVSLIDDVMYDQPPADTANLCRNNFGLIAKDSIMVADNAINRPRIYRTGSQSDTSMQGGNRDYIFHGVAMALGGSVSAFNQSAATRNPRDSTACPTGSAFYAAGGCMQVVGGLIMNRYAAPYNSGVTGSGLRPLRELDPCQLENRRPPYFPLALTRVRPLKAFDVDAQQVNSASLVRAYFNRLRGARAAP